MGTPSADGRLAQSGYLGRRGTRRLLISCSLLLALAAGCKKDAVTTQCLEAAKAYVDVADKRTPAAGQHLRTAIQMCPMACRQGEKDACDADNRVTVALCDLEGKAPCQRMCDEDKNEAACAKAKAMP